MLLLDEPFSNLDVELRERLSIEVRAILKAQGMTALLVTHDQHEAFAMADAVGVMRRGKIEQWDSAYNLYHRPATLEDVIDHTVTKILDQFGIDAGLISRWQGLDALR